MEGFAGGGLDGWMETLPGKQQHLGHINCFVWSWRGDDTWTH